jgi:hypothetical protein
MLYALQTASANLRHIRFEPEKLTDVVIDEDTVDLTRLSGPQWSSHDFSEKEREKTKDKIEPPLPSSENSPPILALSETAAEVAARREQKRKLPLYSEPNSGRRFGRRIAALATQDSFEPLESRPRRTRSRSPRRQRLSHKLSARSAFSGVARPLRGEIKCSNEW